MSLVAWSKLGSLFFATWLGWPETALAQTPTPTTKARIEDALENIATLKRSGQQGYATFWDGNKYVQCSYLGDCGLGREAAGTLMQPSLAHVLVPERLSRLAALGWQLDSSFGNHARAFPAETPTGQIADQILQTLSEAYDTHVENLNVLTQWLKKELCPRATASRRISQG